MANKPIHDNDFYQPETPLISVEVIIVSFYCLRWLGQTKILKKVRLGGQ